MEMSRLPPEMQPAGPPRARRRARRRRRAIRSAMRRIFHAYPTRRSASRPFRTVSSWRPRPCSSPQAGARRRRRSPVPGGTARARPTCAARTGRALRIGGTTSTGDRNEDTLTFAAGETIRQVSSGSTSSTWVGGWETGRCGLLETGCPKASCSAARHPSRSPWSLDRLTARRSARTCAPTNPRRLLGKPSLSKPPSLVKPSHSRLQVRGRLTDGLPPVAREQSRSRRHAAEGPYRAPPPCGISHRVASKTAKSPSSRRRSRWRSTCGRKL